MGKGGGIYLKLAALVVGITLTSISLGVGAYIGSLYSPDNKQYQTLGSPAGADSSYRGPSDSLPDIAGIGGPVERAIANPRPTTGKDHEKRDLAAQEAMAVWSFWLLVTSVIGAVTTMVGTGLLLWQITLTRIAVKDTGDATSAMVRQNELAEHAQRPWIEIDLQYDFGSRRKQGLILAFNVVLRNIGLTPARNANISHFIAPTHRNPRTEMDEMAAAGSLSDGIYQSKMIVLPQGSSQDQELLFIDKDDELHPFDDGVSPHVLITVTYELPNLETAQTSAWFEIGSTDRTDGKPGLIAWAGKHHIDAVRVIRHGYILVT